MSAEQLVAAAAAATGPIVDGDLAGWSEQVRRASSAAVVIAADMERLLEALADPELKMHVRKVAGVTQEKGRFIVSYTPPIEVSFKGQATSYSDFRTGWVEEPHARQIARTARESIGSQCIFFQLNEHNEGDAEAPASGYRRLIHLEPVPGPGREQAAARPPVERQAPAAAQPQPPAPAPAAQVRQPDPTPEVAPQPTLADAQPPLVVVDERPADSALLAIAEMLTDEELGDLSAPLRPDVVAAFRLQWFNKLAQRQRRVRQLNDEAAKRGEGVASIHDPKTTVDLLRVVNLSRDLLAEQGAPA